jgi:hypothetical protein
MAKTIFLSCGAGVGTPTVPPNGMPMMELRKQILEQNIY